MLQRVSVFLYGIVCYLIGATAYFFGLGGFLANLLGSYSVDVGTQTSILNAILVNIGLIVLFGLLHSLMAREGFKRIWTRLVPPAMERSTYMLQAGLFAGLLIWQWQAIPITIWKIDDTLIQTAIWGIYWLGWAIAFITTFLINHFELTGLQQVFAYLRGKDPIPPKYRTPLFYKVVRHPMQFGVLLAFWATPHMTVGHLVFAIGMTSYILIGLHFEERDLVKRFGDAYRKYQNTTPMLLPVPRLNNSSLIDSSKPQSV